MILRQRVLSKGRVAIAKPATLSWRRALATATDSGSISSASNDAPPQPTTARASPKSSLHPALEGMTKLEQFAADFHQKQQYKRITKGLGSKVQAGYHPAKLISQPHRPEEITLELLMASQSHMGHATSLWHPANSRYIYGVRQGIHIISLDVTASHLRRACKIVESTARRGGLILFVGTRDGQERSVVRAAELAGGCHVYQRWIPGSITNRNQILGKCRVEVKDEFDRPTTQFDDQLSEHPALKPDLVVVLNMMENFVLLRECQQHNIPTIGIVDTDCNPTLVTYPVPANDDSLRCTNLIAGVLGRAAENGKYQRLALAQQGQVTFGRHHYLKSEGGTSRNTDARAPQEQIAEDSLGSEAQEMDAAADAQDQSIYAGSSLASPVLWDVVREENGSIRLFDQLASVRQGQHVAPQLADSIKHIYLENVGSFDVTRDEKAGAITLKEGSKNRLELVQSTDASQDGAASLVRISQSGGAVMPIEKLEDSIRYIDSQGVVHRLLRFEQDSSLWRLEALEGETISQTELDAVSEQARNKAAEVEEANKVPIVETGADGKVKLNISSATMAAIRDGTDPDIEAIRPAEDPGFLIANNTGFQNMGLQESETSTFNFFRNAETITRSKILRRAKPGDADPTLDHLIAIKRRSLGETLSRKDRAILAQIEKQEAEVRRLTEERKAAAIEAIDRQIEEVDEEMKKVRVKQKSAADAELIRTDKETSAKVEEQHRRRNAHKDDEARIGPVTKARRGLPPGRK